MIKFIYALIDKTTGEIAHVTEKSTPFEFEPFTPDNPNSYIVKKFSIDCDKSVNAYHLRMSLEDNDHLNSANMPTVKFAAEKTITDKIIGLKTLEEGLSAFNTPK